MPTRLATRRPVAAARGASRRAGSRPRRIRDSILPVRASSTCGWAGRASCVRAERATTCGFTTPRTSASPADWRRMVYLHKPRMAQDDTFGAFDCPDAGQLAPRRTPSTTALQALNLLNSPFVVAAGRAVRRARGAGSGAGPGRPGRPRVPPGVGPRTPPTSSARRARGSPASTAAGSAGRCSTPTSSCSCLDALGRIEAHARPTLVAMAVICSTAATSSARPGAGSAASRWRACCTGRATCAAAEGKPPIRPAIDPARPHAPRPPHFAAQASNVLVIFCSRRVSQLDTFDYKPELIKRDGQPLPGRRSWRHLPGRERQPGRPAVRVPPARRVRQDDVRPAAAPRRAGRRDVLHPLDDRKTNTHGPAENLMSTGFTLDGFPASARG